ncbi:MAG: glycosyltransferase family 2 protein [Steroidobacteraceae bacterium]
MPVYNCARHLAAALESLLAQTFTDFELLVADNASTDETAAIVHRYRRRDSRIRYVRHERNAGAPANWNYVAHAARGQYLKWASGNDLAAPSMLARAVEVLDREPAAVLCYGRTQLIDEAGASLGIYGGDIEVRALRPSSRFIHVCRRLVMNNAQHGLLRLGAVRKTRFNPIYPHGDIVFMAELAMLGQFVRLRDVLFYRRWTPESASSRYGVAERREFYAPGSRSPWTLRFVTARRHLGLLRAALTADVPLVDRLRAACFEACHALWAGAGVRRLFGR